MGRLAGEESLGSCARAPRADWAIGLLVGINLVFFGVRAPMLASIMMRAIEEA